MSNYYTFRSSKGTSVTVLRGDGAPVMTGGGGGWVTEDRPRRVSLTIWNGRAPYAMDVPILFDGYSTGRSQEDAISILNQMQMGKDLEAPPTVEIIGGVPVKGISWVLEPDISWGNSEEDVIWHTGDNGKEYRLRQAAVVHLLQHNPEDRLKILNKGKLPGAPRLYTVRQGDDLRSISQKMYGTPTRWKEIQAANGKILRDPKAITKLVGKKIRIP